MNFLSSIDQAISSRRRCPFPENRHMRKKVGAYITVETTRVQNTNANTVASKSSSPVMPEIFNTRMQMTQSRNSRKPLSMKMGSNLRQWRTQGFFYIASNTLVSRHASMKILIWDIELVKMEKDRFVLDSSRYCS